MKHSDTQSIFLELNSDQLPVLSPGVTALITAFDDEDLDYMLIAELLENFPTIVARLISLANSAWSAPVTKITALDTACARLGLGVVKSISVALAISAPFDPSRCQPFAAQRYWARAMGVADTAYRLAVTETENELAKTARTAGLLHNLGLLWMAHQLPDSTGQALQAHQKDCELSVNQALVELIGSGYREAGGYLGRLWQLPAPLPQCMEFHEGDEYIGESWQTAHLIGLAISMVTAWERQELWTATTSSLESLGIDPVDAEQINKNLGSQLERIQNSATALTGT